MKGPIKVTPNKGSEELDWDTQLSFSIVDQSNKSTTQNQSIEQILANLEYQDLTDQKIAKSLICNICERAFHHPVTTECGHTFCKTCLDKSIQTRKECPNCRQSCDKITSAPFVVKDMLDEILCKCTWCDWTGSREIYRSHLYECVLIELSCPYGCPEKVARQDTDTHLLKCTLRVNYCSCGKEMKDYQIEDHMNTDCPAVITKCYQNDSIDPDLRHMIRQLNGQILSLQSINRAQEERISSLNELIKTDRAELDRLNQRLIQQEDSDPGLRWNRLHGLIDAFTRLETFIKESKYNGNDPRAIISGIQGSSCNHYDPDYDRKRRSNDTTRRSVNGGCYYHPNYKTGHTGYDTVMQIYEYLCFQDKSLSKSIEWVHIHNICGFSTANDKEIEASLGYVLVFIQPYQDVIKLINQFIPELPNMKFTTHIDAIKSTIVLQNTVKLMEQLISLWKGIYAQCERYCSPVIKC